MAAEAMGSEGERDPIDPMVLERLRDLPPKGKFLAGLITMFLQEAEPLVTELSTAVAPPDLERVGMLAHKLKGSARAMGANTLSRCCGELEELARERDAAACPGALADVRKEFSRVKARLEREPRAA